LAKDPELERLLRGEAPPPNAGLFGATTTVAQAGIVILPVPWEPTTSYGKGTAPAPAAMVPVSHQLDLFDEQFGFTIEAGIAMDDQLAQVVAPMNEVASVATRQAEEDPRNTTALAKVNALSRELNAAVESAAKKHLAAGKLVGVVGGDHSSPLGLIRALGEKHPNFGILHVDAHFDLRAGYQGYQYSHAAIMYNVLKEVPAVSALVQVGCRDFSKDEFQLATTDPRCRPFTDRTVQGRKLAGESFARIANDIFARLPEEVYLSIDIDGLDPSSCPRTGTPVPGGLSYAELQYLIEHVAQSGRRIIGFDLCEVSVGEDNDGEWDLNVGARVLYKLCGALRSGRVN
jgi:agmatinase